MKTKPSTNPSSSISSPIDDQKTYKLVIKLQNALLEQHNAIQDILKDIEEYLIEMEKTYGQ